MTACLCHYFIFTCCTPLTTDTKSESCEKANFLTSFYVFRVNDNTFELNVTKNTDKLSLMKIFISNALQPLYTHLFDNLNHE